MLSSDQLYALIQGTYVARRLPSGAAKHVEAPRNSPAHKNRDKTRRLIQDAGQMLTNSRRAESGGGRDPDRD